MKIQGTWIAHEVARHLAERTCYFIRQNLIPLFGEDFPESCLKPNDHGFGELSLSEPKRKSKKKKSSTEGIHPHKQNSSFGPAVPIS